MHRIKSAIVAMPVAALLVIGVSTSSIVSGAIPVHTGTPAGCPLTTHTLPECTPPGGPLELSLTLPSHHSSPLCGNCVCWQWNLVEYSAVADWEDSTIAWPAIVGVDATANLQEAWDYVNHVYCGVWRSFTTYQVESDGLCPLGPNNWAPMGSTTINTSNGNSVTYQTQNDNSRCDSWITFYTGSWTQAGCFYAEAWDNNDYTNFHVDTPAYCTF